MPAESSPQRNVAVGKGERLQIDYEISVIRKYCWGEKRTKKSDGRGRRDWGEVCGVTGSMPGQS